MVVITVISKGFMSQETFENLLMARKVNHGTSESQLGDTPQTEIPPFQRKRKIITFNRKHCVACMAINRDRTPLAKTSKIIVIEHTQY